MKFFIQLSLSLYFFFFSLTALLEDVTSKLIAIEDSKVCSALFTGSMMQYLQDFRCLY